MIGIRKETAVDIPTIRLINERAFAQSAEAHVIDNLRRSCPDLLSLVAVFDGQTVGHVLFSPAAIDSKVGVIKGMGLAPVAVLPGYQNRGIGSELTRTGLHLLRERGCPFVIVLGHAEYYPRFGFEKASRYAIVSQWDDITDDAFMILILNPEAMESVSGVARYRDEFDEAM